MIDNRLPGKLVVLAIAALIVGLLSVLGLVLALRFGTIWGVLLLPLAIPAALIVCAVVARRFADSSERGAASTPTRQG